MRVEPGIRHHSVIDPRIVLRTSLLLALALLGACGGGGGGGASRPSITFRGAPTAVPAGGTATLTWSTTGATRCEGSGGWTGVKAVTGSEVVGPIRANTGFVLSCEGDGGSRQAEVLLNVSDPVSTISGRVLIGSTVQVDSDVNDPLATRISNNSTGTAQVLPNPAIVGGYVALAGRGPAGASQPDGDPVDFYRVALAAGQTIELSIAAEDPVADDLDLYLRNTAGDVVDSSLGIGRLERITVPATGSYFVEVRAYSGATGGAAKYRLSLGQNLTTSLGGALRLSDDFVPGEVLLRLADAEAQASGQASGQTSARATTASAGVETRHGLTRVAGAPDREQLFRIPSPGTAAPAGRATAQAATAEPAAAVTPTPSFKTETLRRKWETLVALKGLRQDPAIRWAEPNWVLKASAVPNDPSYNRQRWHYEQARLPAAWDIEQGSVSVTIAIVDSGVRPTHPDFVAKLVDGKDFVRGANAGDGDGIDDDPTDPGAAGPGGSLTFHGTHVAGTAAAAGNNGVGVAGVSWRAKIMPVRVLGNDGAGTLADILQGIRYAAGLANDSGTILQNRATIINLSLGALRSCSQAESEVIAAVRAAGVVVVAAAGNDATSLPASPASCPGVISVAAVNSANSRAFYSNYGSQVRVAAPGGDSTDRDGDGFPDAIYSTHAALSAGSIVNTYDYLIGTSMAAPHVSGVIALMKSVNPSLTPAGIDALLASGAMTRDIGLPGPDELGVGLIDAFAAVQAANNTPPPLQPKLSLSPRSLSFGDVGTEAEVLVSNAGGGSLTINSIFKVGSWLQVTPAQVDATGLGTYRITVNRAGRSPGTYSSFVEFRSSAGNERVEILMEITTSPVVANAGRQYVVLVNPPSGEILRQVPVDARGESVSFNFSNVTPQQYQLLVGSDMDNDGIICDDGEACGAYPVFGEPTLVQPTAADLAFETA
ncbi:MAG: S8 family serine peptidase, partial [Gammaproteobacteria bacterium]